MKHHGDVYSRVQIRKEEVIQSIAYIRKMLDNLTWSRPNSQGNIVTLTPGLTRLPFLLLKAGEVRSAMLLLRMRMVNCYDIK